MRLNNVINTYFIPAVWGAMAMAFLFTGCKESGKSGKSNDMTAGKVQQADWGELDGKKVYLYTLSNSKGVEVKITNYGGIITSWLAPGKNGETGNIVLGFDSLSAYLAGHPYFGALIGRYGNRIGNAKFSIDNTRYTLAANNGENHLHGGNKGFDKVVWDAVPSGGTAGLTLHYLSRDGEEGYPGNLDVTVTYSLTEDNELLIDYKAVTDKPTVVNLTSHCYFNLTGDAGKNILGHFLQINADRYTPVDAGLIPTGELKSVKDGPFDFRDPHSIGERIAMVEGGYDHNFVLARSTPDPEKVATLTDTASGRVLEVFTSEPGLQFYSGNFLDGTLKNRDGKPIREHAALCLETQHYPDSPNKPGFPSTLLKPGETYHSVTRYKVSVQ